jgi:hypothetical protein
MVLPADAMVEGLAIGNVTTPLSLLPDNAGLFGSRFQRDASGNGIWPREPIAIHWDGSVQAADPTVQPMLVTGADRIVDRLGRTAFVQDPHVSATPAFVAQAPGELPVVVGSTAVSTNAWRPGGQDLVFVDNGVLMTWNGTASPIALEPIPMPSDGSFIAGFSAHAVFIAHDGRTWRVPFGECLRCGDPSGHLDGLVIRVLP